MRRRLLLATVAIGLTRAAAAAPAPESGFGLPRDASVDGARVDSLIHFTVAATAVLFVVVGAVLLVALVRHRRAHPAVHSHGSKVSIALLACSTVLHLATTLKRGVSRNNCSSPSSSTA